LFNFLNPKEINMNYRVALLSLAIGAFGITASAQKDFEKPLNKWGKDESLKIVQDSAWAKPYQSTAGRSAAEAGTVAREQRQSVYSGGSDPRSVSRDFGPPPVTLRLHSSEVLRKATVRLQQLDVGYDKMSEEDQAKFDASRKGFLECAICKDYYVITLTKAAFTKGGSVDEGVFQGMSLADLKGNVKLVNDKGEVRELVQFNAPKAAGDSAVFFFKRTDEAGNHLVTPETKEIKFVFENDFLGPKNRFASMLPRFFDFRVSRMIVGDKVLF
jgi:hypothetical protein